LIPNHDRITIGVIGAGTVGSALIEAFKGHVKILVNDPILLDSSCPIESMVSQSTVIFLAVPTPLGKNFGADCTIVISVLEKLFAAQSKSGISKEKAPVICINSAVPPDVISNAINNWPLFRLVVIPEFLREASPVEDILSMRSLVLGGDFADCSIVADLYHKHSNITGEMRTTILPDAIAAAFLKYQENCFLALKVSFMNEFFDVFSRCGSKASWDQVQLAFHQDHERMGTTHWRVPGPDGLRGWGGRCLPKDVQAFRAYAATLGIKLPLIEAALKRNQIDRGLTRS
jgi:UDPglucose 6-dehydrogenase